MRTCDECGEVCTLKVDKESYYRSICNHGNHKNFDMFCNQDCSEDCYNKNNLVTTKDTREIAPIFIFVNIVSVIALLVLGAIIIYQTF